MLMRLPYDMDKSQYYGRGLSRTIQTVRTACASGSTALMPTTSYFPYIRPQESGPKGDMRWWNQTDASGFKFKLKSCKPFYASAIPSTQNWMMVMTGSAPQFQPEEVKIRISSSMQSILVWLVRTLELHGHWKISPPLWR